jgi:hypothetical protein
MKKYLLTLFCVASLILIFSNLADAGKQSKSTKGPLVGSWKCQGSSGNSSLIFESQNRLVFNGEAASYRLVQGAIRVQGDYGPVDYEYSLKGNTLYVRFPDGSRMQCLKTATAEAGGGEKAGSENGGTGAGKADTGKAWQLKGMLCSWAGSSSSASSYSRSTKVAFDGRGGFRYSSESSFSSGAGSAYSGGNPASSGTYRIVGNNVYLTFNDGKTGTAQVHMRQSNGAITELMYGGQLYAAALCN